jgi:predicted NBD/HSP70 family sugar kinase
MATKIMVGLDIGGTYTRVAVVRTNGEYIHHYKSRDLKNAECIYNMSFDYFSTRNFSKR